MSDHCNATVTMKTGGVLLRLGKSDFVERLMLKESGVEEAKRKIQAGGILLDVRTAAEFNFKHLPGAINVPLHDIRDTMKSMDKSAEYLTCCQTGRRSSAAAFILAQHGFRVFVVDGCTSLAGLG